MFWFIPVWYTWYIHENIFFTILGAIEELKVKLKIPSISIRKNPCL